MAFLADLPVLLLALAFLASVFEAPFPAASGAAIPNVAGEENLSWANSLVSMGRYAGLTLGPLLGGVLVASVGAPWVFVGNAISYLVSVALVASVRADFADPERNADQVEEYKGLAAGFRFIRRDRVLLWLLVSWAVFILGMASTLVADPVLAESSGGARSDTASSRRAGVAERSSAPGSGGTCVRTKRPCGWSEGAR